MRLGTCPRTTHIVRSDHRELRAKAAAIKVGAHDQVDSFCRLLERHIWTEDVLRARLAPQVLVCAKSLVTGIPVNFAADPPALIIFKILATRGQLSLRIYSGAAHIICGSAT
jgi:hypothetical protein